MAFSPRREFSILGALLAGLVTYMVIEVIYVSTMGAFIFLHGIPTPGGAPLWIHLANTGIKGAWSALAYALVMRWAFGRVRPTLVAALWTIGLIILALLGGLAMQGVIASTTAENVALLSYLGLGWLVVRDWPSRPIEGAVESPI